MGISMEKILYAEPFLRKHLENPFTKWRTLNKQVNGNDGTYGTKAESLYMLKDPTHLMLVISVLVLVLIAVLGIIIIFLILHKRQQSKICTEAIEGESSGSEYLDDFSDDYKVNNGLSDSN